jgi:hypothetical protein
MKAFGCSELEPAALGEGEVFPIGVWGDEPLVCCPMLVDEAQVGIRVAGVQSGCHQRMIFATIHGGPILLAILGVRVHIAFADPKGTAKGVGLLIFGESTLPEGGRMG